MCAIYHLLSLSGKSGEVQSLCQCSESECEWAPRDGFTVSATLDTANRLVEGQLLNGTSKWVNTIRL